MYLLSSLLLFSFCHLIKSVMSNILQLLLMCILTVLSFIMIFYEFSLMMFFFAAAPDLLSHVHWLQFLWAPTPSNWCTVATSIFLSVGIVAKCSSTSVWYSILVIDRGWTNTSQNHTGWDCNIDSCWNEERSYVALPAKLMHPSMINQCGKSKEE